MENVHLRSQPTIYQELQMGNPKVTKNFGFQQFGSSILSDVDKFAKFNGEFFLQI